MSDIPETPGEGYDSEGFPVPTAPQPDSLAARAEMLAIYPPKTKKKREKQLLANDSTTPPEIAANTRTVPGIITQRGCTYAGCRGVVIGPIHDTLREMCDPGTIIVDDSNPIELAKFCLEQDVDLFIGGVKERPIAYKLGIGFCDHNHERKECLAGFVGMVNFGREVHASVMSPVWNFVPRRAKRMRNAETGSSDVGLDLGRAANGTDTRSGPTNTEAVA